MALDYAKEKSIYLVKDDDGNVINRVLASESFMSENFSNYELHEVRNQVRNAALYKESELERVTDLIADEPSHEDLTHRQAYKTALEAWDVATNPTQRPETEEERKNNA